MEYIQSDYFPGPRINDENGGQIEFFDVREVLLWIRVKEFYRLFNYPCTLRKCVIKGLVYNVFFCIIILQEK